MQQVIRDLKGADFDEKLTYTTADGIMIRPFYTLEDTTACEERRPLFSHTDWEVCEELEVKNEKEANKKALHALNNGASALVFHLHAAADPAVLLEEIRIEYIALQFVVTGDAAAFAKKLQQYIRLKKLDAARLNISIRKDAIARFLRTGAWEKPVNEAKQELCELFSDNEPLRTLTVDAAVFQNAGATPAYEIGCALAQLNAYAGWLEEAGIKASALHNRIQLSTAVGPDYFFEIAKLRAYRKVMALFFEEYGISGDVHIHAETSFRTMTVFDAHNNLLRAATEAMAAAIGGCNSLSVLPFDATCGKEENEFSGRLSRNIQLILKSESYFDKIADAAAGTYFIEELTEQLAQKAWSYFTEIEKEGGMVAAIEKGSVQSAIKAFADKEQADFDSGKKVLVGTNKFPDTKENKKETADDIVWGNENAKSGKALDLSRLAVKNEKQRISNSHTSN